MTELRVHTNKIRLSAGSALAVSGLILGGMLAVGATAAAHAGTATATPSGTIVTLVPNRIADSRIFEWFPTFTATEEQDLPVLGRGGVPETGVAGVVLNVTVVNPQTAGFFTVWPWDKPQPNTSNVNFAAHQTIANTVIVRTSPDGTISFFNGSHGNADILVDVEGYIAS